MITPITVDSADAASPTSIEMRAPKMTRLRMSRPRLSVPSQYVADGGESMSLVCSFVHAVGRQNVGENTD